MNPNPFDKLVKGDAADPDGKDTAVLMQKATESDIQTSILIYNRAGGNAPFIAQRIVVESLAK